MSSPAESPSSAPDWWRLEPGIAFLNHGSFGACPSPVLEAQLRFRDQMEAEPVRFMRRELEPLLDESRSALSAAIGADAEGLAFLPNATSAANAVLRSLDFRPGDEIVLTDHAYNAVRNAAEYAAARVGGRVVTAAVPFPIDSGDQVVEAVLDAVSPATRLAVVDHVTSPTGLVLPIDRLVAALGERGVDTLVDGAHAPGMVPLDVTALGAAYYAGNCHKWLCAPKGAGFLVVRPDRRHGLVPPVVSHGLNSSRSDRSRFHLLFDWVGTADPTAYLAVPEALRFLDRFDGGLAGVMTANRALAVQARGLLADALAIDPPAPESMLGSMAALPLPPAPPGTAPVDARTSYPIQDRLLDDHGIEVPIAPWPAFPARLLRISAQRYNHLDQYRRLSAALQELLAAENSSPM